MKLLNLTFEECLRSSLEQHALDESILKHINYYSVKDMDDNEICRVYIDVTPFVDSMSDRHDRGSIPFMDYLIDYTVKCGDETYDELSGIAEDYLKVDSPETIDILLDR